MIEWKLKKDAEIQGSGDGFWYDLISGGYIKPEEVLASEDQLEELKRAIEIVESFEQLLEENGLIEEC